jgi:uncharacterized protein
MSKIVIGESSAGKDVRVDLDILLRTRLLLQANSGKGKSWLLRRLAEQLFGKVQVIIIDPEGEFATLREKFDYVLVGKGGETAAHPRIAAMTAQRLLELRACAVCDLYEMKPSERHAYVKNFIEALLDAPKNLWHPLVVIVDEAHVYCPEKGAGESEASEAIIGLATRGRKRGYCLVAATQRLGKFRKDAASELLNVGIGGTFIDIDRKRAADALGVYGQDIHPFFDEIRLLERGKFYFLGPAISTERVLVGVGPVQTSHPEAGSAKHAAEPPPTPEKIQALLPKLADLPQEAERKAKTEADMKAEIRALKTQLSQTVKVGAVVDHSQAQQNAQSMKTLKAALGEAMKIIAKVTALGFEGAAVKKEDVEKALLEASVRIAKDAETKVSARSKEFDKMRREAASLLERMRRILTDEQIEVAVTVKHNEPFTVTPPAPRQNREPIPFNGNGDLTGPESKIMRAMGELLSIGKDVPPKNMVAGWAGYSPVGGAFGNPMGALRSRGLIDYPQPGAVMLTEAGRKLIGECEPPDAEEIWRRIEGTCTGPEVKILRALIETAKDGEISKAELAEKAGYSPIGGAFGNPVGALRTKGLLDYPRQGMVKAADWLFVA